MTIARIEEDHGIKVIETQCGRMIYVPASKVPPAVQIGHRIVKDLEGNRWSFFDQDQTLLGMVASYEERTI